jgi:Macrocin-O-methyltransferase (TylF)
LLLGSLPMKPVINTAGRPTERATEGSIVRSLDLKTAANRMLASLVGPAGVERAKYYVNSWRRLTARRRLVLKPTDPHYLEVLEDPLFQRSVAETRFLTASDTARLANLWQLCRMSRQEGTIVEVGAYRGGTALHLSNCRPGSRIFVCDTFDGYVSLPLETTLDRREVSWREENADGGPFQDVNAEAVASLFRAKGRDAVVLKGRFPASDEAGQIQDVIFAHVDVVLYQSCRDALEYLRPRALASAIFVVNDYRRNTGIARAVGEFVAQHEEWMAFPLYPGQGMLFNRARFGP